MQEKPLVGLHAISISLHDTGSVQVTCDKLHRLDVPTTGGRWMKEIVLFKGLDG